MAPAPISTAPMISGLAWTCGQELFDDIATGYNLRRETRRAVRRLVRRATLRDPNIPVLLCSLLACP
jgi:hypothetical protein